MTLTRCPSGSVDTPTLVNTGGSDREVWFSLSVTVTKTGEESVVSGVSVTVLVVVGVGLLMFACIISEASSEPFPPDGREMGEGLEKETTRVSGWGKDVGGSFADCVDDGGASSILVEGR